MCLSKAILNFIGELINSDGNRYFQREDYIGAITQYSRAIFFYPKENISKCLTNRCSCYMLLKNYKAAIQDSIRAITNDRCERAYEQLIESLLRLGDLFEAEFVMFTMSAFYPDNEIIPKTRKDIISVVILLAESDMCYANKNYTEAITKISSAMQICTACESSIALRDKCVSAKIIQTETSSITFKYAYEQYEEARWDYCIEHLNEVLLIDPYHLEALELWAKIEKFKGHYESSKSFFEQKNYSRALRFIKEAIKIDPINKQIQILYQKCEERKLLAEVEDTHKNDIRTLMNQAQRHYDADEYELCLSRCDEIISKANCVKAACLKKDALTQLCNQNIIEAKDNFSTEMYKECVRNCNNVLTRTKPFISFEAYIKEANSMLSDVRKHIETIMIQANLNYKKRLFDECITNCEHILRIENSSEASSEAVKLLNNSKSLKKFEEQKKKEHSHLLHKTLAEAKSKFDSEAFDECIKKCEFILSIFEFSKARDLLEMAKSHKITQTEITNRIFQVKKYYNTKMFKECIEECRNILEIKETTEIRLILVKIKELIDKTMAQANRQFELEYFDQCIEACELILSIEYSCEAANLLKLAKEEEVVRKRVKDGLANARNLYNGKCYKACIEECKQILKIRQISEANHLIDLCKTNQLAAAQLKMTNRFINNANKFYEIKDYKKCLANCYKALKITELQEAREIIQKVKIEKKNRKYINDVMIRANQHYTNQKFENCITECEKVLKIEQLMEALTLMEKAKIELQNVTTKRILNARQQYSKAEYKECVENCSAILKQQEIVEVKEMLVRCKSALAYEKLTDPYKILQVERNSDQTTIRSSYHLLSFRYHPDKHSKSTQEMRIYNENLYKKITNAYRTLSQQ